MDAVRTPAVNTFSRSPTMVAHHWVRHLATLLFFGGLYIGFVSAQETGDTKKATPLPPKVWKLPGALQSNKPAESIEELRDIEKHVQKVLQKVMPAVVGVQVGGGQGSGVIVKEDGTILTAGHVSGRPDQKARVIMTGGKRIDGKTLGKNGGIDSGMMKITTPEGKDAKYPFLEMGKSADLKPGQWVIAVGHPGGFRDNRTPVVRVGRILFANQFVIRTDCTLVGGDSGGPLFDMQGRVIGIHSRIGGFAITENMHVPIDTYRQTWDRLAKGEAFGGDLGQMPTVLSLGGRIVFESKDKLTKDDGTEPCPKDPKDKNLKSYRKVYNFAMLAGHSYTIDLVSSDPKGNKLDTFLRLLDANGTEIANDDDGGGFPHSRIVYRAPQDGNYSIIATSFESFQTGAFTLTVRDADFRAGQVEVLKAVKLPLPTLEKALQKFAEAKRELHINALLVDDKGAPLAGKEITVKWAQGTEKVKTDSTGLARWALKKDRAKALSLELPKGTRAAVLLTDQNGNNLFFGAGNNDPSVETVKSAGGKIVKTIEGTIVKTDPFDLEREKCYRQFHTFKMSAGKIYTIDLVSEDFDSYLRVEHDDKGKLVEDDDGGGFLNSRIVFTPKEDATYRLVVTTCDPGQAGAYRMIIRETNAKAAEPK